MTFEQQREQSQAIWETGQALGQAHFERGGRLTDNERSALRHNSMWGSTGYPVMKLGRKWTVAHPAGDLGLFQTKSAAIKAWETLIAKWIHMSGLEAQARALKELRANV